MKTYINKGGQHTTLDGRLIEHGKTITCEEALDVLFPTKFFELPTAPVAPAPGGVAPAGAATTKEAAAHGGADTTDGKDVTAEYPEAEKAGLTVRQDAKGLWVYDGAKEPAHEKPLKKAGVMKFIKEYAAEV